MLQTRLMDRNSGDMHYRKWASRCKDAVGLPRHLLRSPVNLPDCPVAMRGLQDILKECRIGVP